MRRFVVRFSESEASNHTPSSAEFTTNTPELKFSVHTTAPAMDLIAEAFEKTTDSDGGPIVRPSPGRTITGSGCPRGGAARMGAVASSAAICSSPAPRWRAKRMAVVYCLIVMTHF
jgi:hypothetical protein